MKMYCLQLVFFCTYFLFFWHNHLCCGTRFLGEIVISEENVQVLLPASSILQMATVREACCKFLMRQLHPTNCLGIRSFAGKNVTKIIELHPIRLVNCKTILVFNYVRFQFQIPMPVRNYINARTSEKFSQLQLPFYSRPKNRLTFSLNILGLQLWKCYLFKSTHYLGHRPLIS